MGGMGRGISKQADIHPSKIESIFIPITNVDQLQRVGRIFMETTALRGRTGILIKETGQVTQTHSMIMQNCP